MRQLELQQQNISSMCCFNRSFLLLFLVVTYFNVCVVALIAPRSQAPFLPATTVRRRDGNSLLGNKFQNQNRQQQQQQQQQFHGFNLLSSLNQGEDNDAESSSSCSKPTQLMLERERKELFSLIELTEQLRQKLTSGENTTTTTDSLLMSSAAAAVSSTTTTTDDAKVLAMLEEQVKELETEMEQRLLTPIGVSTDEFLVAMKAFLQLPLSVRLIMCQILVDVENNNKEQQPPQLSDEIKATIEGITLATDWRCVRSVITKLYNNQDAFTPERVQPYLDQKVTLMEEYLSQTSVLRPSSSIAGASKRLSSSSPGSDSTNNNEDNKKNRSSVPSFLGGGSIFSTDGRGMAGGASPEEYDKRTQGFLMGRVARFTDRPVPTKADLKTLMSVLGKETFVATGTDEVPGGYIIRGENRKKTGAELIQALDQKLVSNKKDWHCQVCFVYDNFSRESRGSRSDPVLFLGTKDLSATTSPYLLSSATIAAVISAILYSLGVYGANDSISQILSEQSELGSDVQQIFEFMNGKVLEVLLPILALQGIHELGHYVVALKDNLKLSPPTLVPAWSLPLQGAKTELKESPETLTSLFDFAFAAPLLGSLASIALLFFGLEATSIADPETLKLFPSLPVSVIESSTLGSTIMDYWYGGPGMITLLDPKTPLPLHPFAIAGYLGMLIQALELLPLGSTDGGRLSLSLFGRQGHFLIGGTTWFLLLFSSLFLNHADILVGAWIIYNFSQNDPEIPSRNEVDKVDLVRSFSAFALWFYAVSVIIPMQ